MTVCRVCERSKTKPTSAMRCIHNPRPGTRARDVRGGTPLNSPGIRLRDVGIGQTTVFQRRYMLTYARGDAYAGGVAGSAGCRW